MKKTVFSILIITLFSLLLITSVQAQSPVDSIETLIIDFWPDYDQPNVLVLLTGTLSADTPLPATVTLPLPADAELNAVARITSDNRMASDIEYSTGNNKITLTTPDPRFRIEYYAPYDSIGSNHAFSYNWLADVDVEDVLVAVQQPASAASMNVTPENATMMADTTDGFTYYTIPSQPIPAGEQFTIAFDYDMATPQLSFENLPVPAPAPETNTSSAPAASSSSNAFALDNINWALVAGLVGVILIAVAVTWQITARNNQPMRKNRKPRPKRAAQKSADKARFCHECGSSLTAQDKFCRECGTAVKGSV